MVTENGLATDDDTQRLAYLETALDGVAPAWRTASTSRLHRLDRLRQLRVDLRLPAQVRPDRRGPHHPGAHPEAERPLAGQFCPGAGIPGGPARLITATGRHSQGTPGHSFSAQLRLQPQLGGEIGHDQPGIHGGVSAAHGLGAGLRERGGDVVEPRYYQGALSPRHHNGPNFTKSGTSRPWKAPTARRRRLRLCGTAGPAPPPGQQFAGTFRPGTATRQGPGCPARSRQRRDR